MKTKSCCLIVWIIILGLNSTLHAQVALNKAVSGDSLMNYLNGLLKDNSSAAREQLLKEAAVLSKRSTEEELALALKIYNVADDSVHADKLEQQIVKKFPGGVVSRDLAYAHVFSREPHADISQTEAAWQEWIKRFPPAHFNAQQQGKYHFALLALVQEFSKQHNVAKVDTYLQRLNDSSIRTVALYNAGNEFLLHDQPDVAEPWLVEALSLSRAARAAANMKARTSFGALSYENIVNAYGKLLLKKQQPDSVIRLLQPLLKDQQFGGMNAASLTLTMARALQMTGKQAAAFSLLNDYFVRNTASKEGLEVMEPLYLSLYPSSTFGSYREQLKKAQYQLLQEKLAKEMVREKADDFSLTDMNGQPRKLADYKGKIVVIDFWATWCVPCVSSFPMMKELMAKYQDNENVAFLFINTWETNPDYQNNVKQLMQQHQYPFTVLYDDHPGITPAERVAARFKVAGLPTKFILDGNSDIRFRVNGAKNEGRPEEETLSAMIDLLLSGK